MTAGFLLLLTTGLLCAAFALVALLIKVVQEERTRLSSSSKMIFPSIRSSSQAFPPSAQQPSKRTSPLPKPPVPPTKAPPLSVLKSRKAPVHAVGREVEAKLLRLLNGNHATALRLVQQAQLRNPDRSEQWCWEKVISDLERDRRV